MSDGDGLGRLLEAVRDTTTAMYRLEQEVFSLLAEDRSNPSPEPQQVATVLDDWFTQGELGDWLKVSRTTVYRLLREGRIPTYRIGRSVRVRRTDVERWLADEGRDGW